MLAGIETLGLPSAQPELSLRGLFIGGALRLGSGQVGVQLCSFVRSVILARLLSPEDFGIAATFAMTFSLIEMVSNLSVQSLIVQAPDGDAQLFQSTGQLLLVLRGFSNAIFLLVLAFPLSSLFGVPQAWWAFCWVAAIPVLRGFCHLDLNRFQRDIRFVPQVATEIVSNLLVTLLAWPIAAWLRNYAAMLWLLLLQAAFYTIGSHVVAERRYAWAWRREYLRRFVRFGWPLIINGLLMYGILQGDRFIIGAARRLFSRGVYTLADLGVYSVAFAVTMAPSTFFTGVANSLFLPVLARAQTEQERFRRRYAVCVQTMAFAAVVIAVPFVVAGQWIVPLIYGSKYAAAGTFIGWLGAMWGIRVFRTAPTQAALALGDSRNSMIANIARSAALIGVLISAATGYSLASIAVCGLAGEVVATAVCLVRLSAKHHISTRISLAPIAMCGSAIVAALVAQFAGFGGVILILIGAVLLGVCAGTTIRWVGREHGWDWVFGKTIAAKERVA